MRKLLFLCTTLLISILILGACGNKPGDGKKEEPSIQKERETEGGSLETGQGFGFTIFNLEIDVNGEDVIDVDYDVKDQATANYENKLNDIDLEGAGAMDKLNILFTDILITKDTPEDEVIEKILEFYEIDAYSKFELSVDFDEGTKLRINESK